jgi:hypothetical protein
MTPTAESQDHLRGALRGAVEGAALGFVIVVVRMIRLWLGGADTDELGDHLGEIGLYSFVVICTMAYIFGMGRAISGGWVGALVGAAAMGLGGLGIGAQILRPTPGPPIGLFALLAVGGLIGAFLGAVVERFVRQRRGRQQGRETPVGDGPG